MLAPTSESTAPSLRIECATCGAAIDLEPDLRTATCPYCASPSVVERPPSRERPPPAFVLGFVLPRASAVEISRKWVKGRWLAPGAFRKARIDETRGVYLPAYLYSAAAYSDFTAEIGENYTVTETYRDSKGHMRTRTKTKTEWRSLSGRHATYVDDIVVTASRGIPNAELEAVEPFDLRALHRYTPRVIAGWISEEPSLAVEECAGTARQEALREVGRRLGWFMPGDSHRALAYSTTLDQEDARIVLLPVWVLPVRYREDKPPVRLLVNGQTGKIHGKRPLSAVKVTLLVLAILLPIVALIIGYVMESR